MADTSIPSGGPVDPALIDDLVVASRILAKHGVLDAWGHVSMRHPKNPERYLISRARAPALVEASDIMELDLDSNPVAGEDLPSALPVKAVRKPRGGEHQHDHAACRARSPARLP